jgi:hypothetical protein
MVDRIPKAQAPHFIRIDNRERRRDEADRIAAQIAIPVAHTPVAGAIIERSRPAEGSWADITERELDIALQLHLLPASDRS